MKRISIILALIILCFSGVSLAIIVSIFSDSDTYTKRAKDIVIVECLPNSTKQGYERGMLPENCAS